MLEPYRRLQYPCPPCSKWVVDSRQKGVNLLEIPSNFLPEALKIPCQMNGMGSP